MIVDTSALIAILLAEPGADRLTAALAREQSLLPAPAFVEYRRVASRKSGVFQERAAAIAEGLLAGPMRMLAFSDEHAQVAAAANRRYGAGLGLGGTLNLLDLMVYACARVERRPILCTGRAFAATDAAIHAASRIAD